MKKKNNNRCQKILLKLFVSLCLFCVLIGSSDLNSLWHQFKQIDLLTLWGCVAALCLAQFLSSLRWQWILTANNSKIPLSTLFGSYMAGMFLNNFVPTSIGGDVFKTYDIYRLTQNLSLGLVSVFIDRLAGVIALLSLSWFGAVSILSTTPLWAKGIWFAINALFIVLLLIMFNVDRISGTPRIFSISYIAKIAETLQKSHELFVYNKEKKKLVLKLLVISFPVQLVTIIIYQQVAAEMDVNLPFYCFLFIVPMITIVSLAPISLGGLGVREAMTVLLLTDYNVSTEASLSISLIVLLVTYTTSIIGGFFLMVRSTKI